MWRLLYSTLRQPQHRRQAAAVSALTGVSAVTVSTSSVPLGQISSAGNNITFCDADKAPKPPNLTFRKRRLSIASPQDGSDGEDEDKGKGEGKAATAKPKKSKVSDDTSSEATITRTSYAIEIEGSAKTTSNSIDYKKKMFADFLADLGIKGMYEYDRDDEDDVADTSTSDLQHKHHTTYAKPSLSSPSAKQDKPFPDEKVGAFSAHGIEPHPYIVKEEAASFFSSQLEPQIVTLVTQKINQDRGIVSYPFGKCPRTALFGVFDGHGLRGELVAEYTMNEIAHRLHKHSKFKSNLDAAFTQTFLGVDKAIERRHDVEPYHSGTTACVVVLRDDALSVSNVGDSRAVIGRRRQGRDKPYALPVGPTMSRYECIELTKDQNAADPTERKRVERSGGFVGNPIEPGLPTRIYLDKECTLVGLAMSRSIGDWNMKKVGVIAQPVVTHHAVTDRDEFLIVASDGIWEFIDSEDAVKIVGDCLDRGCTASEASIQLIRHAMKTWRTHEGDYRDDCTAIVVRLPGLWNE